MDWWKAGGSTVGGAVAGASVSAIIGNIGIAAGGTAIGVGMAPFVALGAGLGIAGYGIYKLGEAHGREKGDEDDE